MAVLVLAVWLGWGHLRFWWRFESMGQNAQGYPEYRHRQTGIIFVRVPGGMFWMGAQSKDPAGPNYDADAREEEGPVHDVILSPFLIAEYEVTQRQWEAIMGDNPSYFNPRGTGSIDLPAEFRAGERWLELPVETVTWSECEEFCRETCLVLPTEAQWEYACRSGSKTAYSGTGRLPEMGWQGNYPSHPGGLKKPNDFGLYDMHGNVAEWCQDVYDERFYSKAEASMKDPVCRTGSGDRVYRGGGWEMAAFLHRSAARSHSPTNGPRVQRSPPGYLGFRPAFWPLP